MAEWSEKPVAQARRLRERIGRALGRVKDWVRERFPDPLRQIKGRSREVLETVAETVRGRSPAASEQEPGRDPASDKKRGKFDGHKQRTNATSRAPRFDADPSSAAELPTALHRSVDRYAQACTDAWQMRERELPILEHQKAEFKTAVRELESIRPGASQDLSYALQFDPQTRRGMIELEGPGRTALRIKAVEQERRIEADPNLKAERFVWAWNALEVEREALKGWEYKEAREAVQERVQGMRRELKRSPALDAALIRRQREPGIDRGRA